MWYFSDTKYYEILTRYYDMTDQIANTIKITCEKYEIRVLFTARYIVNNIYSSYWVYTAPDLTTSQSTKGLKEILVKSGSRCIGSCEKYLGDRGLAKSGAQL